jgi:hypothetical protein
VKVPLRELVRFAFGSIAFWMVIQAYSVSVGRFTVARWPIVDAVAVYGSRALLYALLTPVIVAVVERILAFVASRWVRFLCLAGCVPFFAVAEAVLETALVRHRYSISALSFGGWVRQLTITPNLLLMTLAMLIAQIVIVRRQAAERERRKLELEAEWAETRTERMRDRLRPADLQDILTTIGEAAESETSRARLLLHELAELLRLAMRLDAQSEVPLRDELDLADRYAALRSPSTPLRIDADEEALRTRVAPCSVQTFVESVLSRAGGDVELQVSVSGDVLLRAQSVSSAGAAFVAELRIPVR